jgi:CDGSH-type Zn-finger protein
MPRILLSTAHIVPEVLDSLGFDHQQPALAAPYPALPKPFLVTKERVERLQDADLAARAEAYRERCKDSSQKPFCLGERNQTVREALSA